MTFRDRHLHDRAAIVAKTVLAMTLDADEIERAELQAHLEAILRQEFADVARMIAADLGELP
jgi:hypothetical protein